jgi:hypothetical protein
MLSEIHEALKRLLYEQGHIDLHEVNIEFEPPTKQWVNSLTRPTINLFLFDLQENTDLRQTNLQTTRSNSHAIRRMPPRRFDLRYMVSVLTTVVEDEHVLLWRTLVTLLKYPQLPPEILPETLRALEPPLTTQMSKSEEGPRLLDLWNAFEAPPRPALLYIVTAPVDLEIALEAPLVLTRAARYTRFPNGAALPETRFHIGGMVRDQQGAPLAGARVAVEGSAAEGGVTDSAGRFTLFGVPSGAVTLRVTRTDGAPTLVQIEIPSESYEITVE